MAKMINVDELIEFCNTERSMLHAHGNSVACAALRRVCEFAKENAVEVEPVKHGRWIDFPECLEYEGALDSDYFVCSECHHVWNTIDNCAETFKCCPNCGSKNEDGDGDD